MSMKFQINRSLFRYVRYSCIFSFQPLASLRPLNGHLTLDSLNDDMKPPSPVLEAVSLGVDTAVCW